MNLHRVQHVPAVGHPQTQATDSGLLTAEAILAATNDMGGHNLTVTNLTGLSKVTDVGMLALDFAAASDPQLTPGEFYLQFSAYTIYGPLSSVEAAPIPVPTAAELSEAISIIGNTVGWHFPL